MSSRELECFWNRRQFGSTGLISSRGKSDFKNVTNADLMAAMDHSDKDTKESYPPWNFSWVVDGQLAVMAHPRNEANMQWIWDQGVRHLITLSPEKRPPLYATPQMKWSEICIGEFEAPSMFQMKTFIEMCQRCVLKNEPVGVHCRQGLGRSGVMAACYLVHFQNLTPERAIINLRMQRPRSLETTEQENAVVYYHDCIRGVKGTF